MTNRFLDWFDVAHYKVAHYRFAQDRPFDWFGYAHHQFAQDRPFDFAQDRGKKVA